MSNKKQRLKCIVCNKRYKYLADVVTGEIPVFLCENGNKERIKYRTTVVAQCQRCFDKFGRPIEMHYGPPGKDLCVFEKSAEPVVLLGSEPQD